MAAARAVTEWAGGVEGSSVVVGMARNGTTFGIRLSGPRTGGSSHPPPGRGRALPRRVRARRRRARYRRQRRARADRPRRGRGCGLRRRRVRRGIDGRRGGADRDRGEDLRRPEQPVQAPILGFAGSPVGVDVRKVVELQITPAINTGIPQARTVSGRSGRASPVPRSPARGGLARPRRLGAVRTTLVGTGGDALQEGGDGAVLAWFPRASYVSMPGGLVSLVAPGGARRARPRRDGRSLATDGSADGGEGGPRPPRDRLALDRPGRRPEWRGSLPPAVAVRAAAGRIVDATGPSGHSALHDEPYRSRHPRPRAARGRRPRGSRAAPGRDRTGPHAIGGTTPSPASCSPSARAVAGAPRPSPSDWPRSARPARSPGPSCGGRLAARRWRPLTSWSRPPSRATPRQPHGQPGRWPRSARRRSRLPARAPMGDPRRRQQVEPPGPQRRR